MTTPVSLKDLALSDQKRSPRVEALREAYFRAVPEICCERPLLVTRYARKHGLFDKPTISVLDKARQYRYVLEHRQPVVAPDHGVGRDMKRFPIEARSLFAGSTTSHFKGVPIFPEFMGLALWPELLNIKERASNPYFLADTDGQILNKKVFPYWLKQSVLERCRARMDKDRVGQPVGQRDVPEMVLLEDLVFYITSKADCISHTIPDFSQVLQFGLRGIIEKAQRRRRDAQKPEQREFYAAVAEAMEGIVAFSRNLARAARRLAKRTRDATEKAELLDMAKANEHVPEFPARNFQEGLTAIWICWTALHLENPDVGLSLGRLDQLLYKLYSDDIKNRNLTVDKAIELLCCLWLKIGDHVAAIPAAGEQLFGGTGSNQAITVGGVHPDGSDAVNDLTYLMIRATELMMLRDPNLNARFHPEVNSQVYLRRLCDVNLNTGATPALHNDRAVIEALTSKGDKPEQARDYGIIGCVEPGSNGRFYGACASILINLTSILELTLYNGEHRHTGRGLLVSERTGDAASFASFDAFKAAFVRQVSWMVDRATTLNQALGLTHQEIYPTPILSSLFEGPMDKGKDLIFGGATINSSGATIVGFADVVDSLAAIEQVAFKENAPSLPDLLQALNANFVGYEPLLARLRNPDKTPKYGNEHPAADSLALWVAQTMNRLFEEKVNYRGGHYRVGYWTMTSHAGFGRLSRATPNGRRDGENFTSGMTPVSGMTPRLTPALNSVASVPPALLANGLAVNLKYTPDNSNREKMLDNFMASVNGYFDAAKNGTGGMEIQFNVTSHADFEDAVKNPQAHKELLVRVSGYTAYFKDLNPQMQQEIIDRTEYDLATGQAVQFARPAAPTNLAKRSP
ncbi:MAG TPA: pyruvate formate lyase family protein [Polyangia bacterium]|jgi:Pyruvate-formate lyase|nr:pyruvate formate lyase family protein [Polyangia bacterium]